MNCALFLTFETMLLQRYSEYELEAGTDEAGRGCLSGPVVAAAVILPHDFYHEQLNDSKQLTEKRRQELRPVIEKEALAYGVSFIYQEKIDQINILKASILAMHESLKRLKLSPEFIIVDGNRFTKFEEIPHATVVKGDSKYLSIAAASVLAKTYRDEYMENIHMEYPHYNWARNKGYPTREHRQALRKFGPSRHHRMSFTLLPEQLKLDL